MITSRKTKDTPIRIAGEMSLSGASPNLSFQERVSITAIKLHHKEALDKQAKSQSHSSVTPLMRYICAEKVGRYIYLLGPLCSRSGTGERWTVVAALDFPRKTWRWIFCPGDVGQGSAIFLYEDALYMFGIRDWRGNSSREMSKFDLIFEKWSYAGTTGEKPANRSYFSGHFLEQEKRFLVFGGTYRGMRNDVHLLQMPQRRWLPLVIKGRPPEPRWQHGSCVHNGVFYCYGGWGHTRRYNDGLHVLRFSQGVATWSTAGTNADSFTPLSSYSLVPFGNKLLFCGGYGRDILHQLSVYDPATDMFTELGKKPGDRKLGFGISVVTAETDRSLLIFGGHAQLDYSLQLTLHEA